VRSALLDQGKPAERRGRKATGLRSALHGSGVAESEQAPSCTRAVDVRFSFDSSQPVAPHEPIGDRSECRPAVSRA
jgi:hypothetical protein